MKNTLHTPGPWTHTPSHEHSNPDTTRRDIVAESQFGPAFIAGDVSQSDASLIASAPDLLDALGWSLSYIKVRLASEPDPDHQAAFDAAFATLRKAKGE
jgi:hypothetical protein